MPDFKFNKTDHVYTLDGIKLVSVTDCLPNNPHNNSEEARLKGQFVHQMVYFENMGILEEETLDPQLQPFLEAYRLFLKEIGLSAGVWDIKSGSLDPCTVLQIAGYILLANEGLDENNQHLAQDRYFEKPLYHPTYLYAGTPDIVIADKLLLTKGYALYLKDNGKYKPEEVKDVRSNINFFLSFLTTYKWNILYGITQRQKNTGRGGGIK